MPACLLASWDGMILGSRVTCAVDGQVCDKMYDGKRREDSLQAKLSTYIVIYSEAVQSYIVSCGDFHPMIDGMSNSFAYKYSVRQPHGLFTIPDSEN